MSKLSLAGLIGGLLLVGILFFGVGYLAAVATYGSSSTTSTPTEKQITWAGANTEKEKPAKGKPSPLDKLAGSGVASDIIKKQTAAIGAKFGVGNVGNLTQTVPGPLKPFAASAQNKAAIAAQRNIETIGTRLQRAATSTQGPSVYTRQNEMQRPLSPQEQIRAQFPQQPGQQAPKLTPFGTPVPQAPAQAPLPQQGQVYGPAYAPQPLYKQ